MTTAVDTNVFVGSWDADDALNSRAVSALNVALERGCIVVSGAVYAELVGLPGRSEKFLDKFFLDTGVIVDWKMDESIWRSAGKAFAGYAARRQKQRSGPPRGILADFLIGAHALENGYTFLTFDDRLFRAAFPKLRLIGL